MKDAAMKQHAKIVTAKSAAKKAARYSEGDMPITPASRPMHGAAGKTGTWRTFKPIVDKATCKKCGNCILYCPEGCIDRDLKVDYDYCKGCGICAKECPSKSITMERE
jgi:pyruvate ferredoxin oxidoreductase delta subunit